MQGDDALGVVHSWPENQHLEREPHPCHLSLGMELCRRKGTENTGFVLGRAGHCPSSPQSGHFALKRGSAGSRKFPLPNQTWRKEQSPCRDGFSPFPMKRGQSWTLGISSWIHQHPIHHQDAPKTSSCGWAAALTGWRRGGNLKSHRGRSSARQRSPRESLKNL